MKKNKFITILTSLFILAFLGYIAYCINAFTGNPISKAIATSKIRSYVNKTYSTLDLMVPEAKYNFKDSSYYSIVKSETSEDTHFSISYGNGRINDSYEYEIGNKYTTYSRLSNELDKTIEDILAKDFLYKTDMVLADFTAKLENYDKLTLDMPLDITNLPLPAQLSVYIYSDEINFDILAARMLEVRDIMKSHNIKIDIYSIILEDPDQEARKTGVGQETLYLYDFPADKIKEDGLADILKVYKEQKDKEDELIKKNEMKKE
jgi:hypothetical protein